MRNSTKIFYISSASSVDDEGSPKDPDGNGYDNEDDDNSILWSAATRGGKFRQISIKLSYCILT